jgi:hypothetical protein
MIDSTRRLLYLPGKVGTTAFLTLTRFVPERSMPWELLFMDISPKMIEFARQQTRQEKCSAIFSVDNGGISSYRSGMVTRV